MKSAFPGWYSHIVHNDDFPELTAETDLLGCTPEPVFAHLGWRNDWGMLADSYFEAADSLASLTLLPYATDRPSPNEVLAPILFLYRHWLELELKAVLHVAHDYDGEGAPSKGHQLLPLWERARGYMEGRWPSQAYGFLEKNVRLLDTVDEKSMAFRYPDGPIPDELMQWEFDLQNIRQVFRAIHPWLSGVLDARDAEAQAEAEMREYFAGDYDGGDYDVGPFE